MSFDWKGMVRSVAPGIAGALGGPFAALGVRKLSDALLGKPDGTTSEIAQALASATPDQLLALKKADQEFAEFMAKLEVDMEGIAAQDRANAREMQEKTRSWVPAALSIAVTIGFFGLIGVLCDVKVPAENRDTLNILLGSLGTAWVTIVAFWFGSSSGSARKDEILGKVATS